MRIALLLILLVAGESFSATINVPADHATIQEAIDAAAGGDTVLVAAGTYEENIDFSGKDIKLKSTDGAAVTVIDGGKLDSVVTFQSGETAAALLEGFTLTNGSGAVSGSKTYGGGVYCLSSSPTIRNNIVNANSADYGAGIFCLNASPLIDDNTVSENTATYGGGIRCFSASSPTIVENAIHGNSAAKGGGVSCYNLSSPLMERNQIHDNTASDIGGGFYCANNCSPTLTNNLIHGNTSDNLAGGIYCLDSSPSLSFVTMQGNSAVNDGGAFYLENSSPSLTNSILWENSAANGPSIFLVSGSPAVMYCDVEGGFTGTGNLDTDPLFMNTAAADFHLKQDPCQPGVTNACVNSGDPGATMIDGSTRTDWEQDSGVVDMGYHYDLEALLVPGEYSTIQAAVDAAVEGQGVLVGPGTYVENIDFLGKDLVIKSVGGPAATVIDGSGGVSVVTFKLGESSNSVLEGFTLTNGTGSSDSWGFISGGGVYCDGASPTLINLVITNNTAFDRGGGVYCNNASPGIVNCTISNNSTSYDGAGIYCWHSSAPAITFNTFTGNQAGFNGGAVYLDHSDPLISENSFTLNTAGYRGGAIYCYYADPEIKLNTVSQNTASTSAGGIGCFESSPLISENTVENNKANLESGGGIYSFSAAPTIEKNTITGNTAGADGGGVWCSQKNPVIAGNTISGNTASAYGGGVKLDESNAGLEGNTITQNVASIGGGGVCCAGAGAPVLENNRITENSAGYGGGFLLDSTMPVITNNTVVANTASQNQGGGLWCWKSYPTIANTIFWNDSAAAGPELYLAGNASNPSAVTLLYCDVQGGKSQVHVDPGCTLDWGFGMIITNPSFLGSDYRLAVNSPCINRGKNSVAPLEDIDGDARPTMGTVDMGADEFTGLHLLEADTFTISQSTGGMITLDINGGISNGSRNYLICASITGNAPGTPLPGGVTVLPVNADVFSYFVLEYLNTAYFINFMGKLLPNGYGMAMYNTQGAIPGSLVGYSFSLAGAFFHPWDYVTNPVDIEIVP